MFVAVKTSTRKRVDGRKRVSKQNKLINVDRAVTTLKSTTSSTLSKFVQSYQAVAVFMFSFGILTVLSIFSQGGPVGEVVFNVLQWAFGYGVFALPVFFFYGSAILIRDRETVKAQRVLVGTFWVQIFSASMFHSLIHAQPLSLSAGSELLLKSGGHISAFIVYPLTNSVGLQMTHTILLLGLIMSVLYMTDIELKDLLKVFWEAHDPTQGMRQGNDIGSQYRSVVFIEDEADRNLVELSMSLFQEELYNNNYGTITTEISMTEKYFLAEEYHQQYLAKNPNGYCGIGGTGCEFKNIKKGLYEAFFLN